MLGVVMPLLARTDSPTPARPPAITTEHVPPITAEEFQDLKRYQELREAWFVDWHSEDKGMLVATRTGGLTQLHLVSAPGEPPRQLTAGTEPVQSARFLSDGSFVFPRGVGGNERFQVYRFDIDGQQETLLTDGDSRHLMLKRHPDGRRLAVTSTRRNGRDQDIYLIDAQGEAEASLIFEVKGETWTLADFSPDGKRAILQRYISRNESYAQILDLETLQVSPLPSEIDSSGVQAAQRISRAEYHFTADSGSIVFLSDARGEFREVVRLELATGRATWLSPAFQWDVVNMELAPDRKRALIELNVDGYSRLYRIDDLDAPAPRLNELALPNGLVGVLRFSPDGSRVGFTFGRSSLPEEAYSLELKTGELQRWTFSDRAGFSEDAFVDPELIRYKSFDDRRIPAFVFLPKNRQPAAKWPVVITIHGGPESQYVPWFSIVRQQYVSGLGVAVIAPNVRGSTGYGKTYSLLDNGLKREDSVRDIGALLDWIATDGVTKWNLDPERVAVIGGSYGGYMVLASLVHFGDRLRAGIDRVGISDFTTFLENTSGYRRQLRREEYGDERDPEMRAFFERISPARRIDKLKSALFLVHGENDPRVPFSEAKQIVERARSSGSPVWTLYAENEGHGFRRRENRDYLVAAENAFLKRFLLEEK